MERSMIKVKYIGKWDAMTCDYNGKRYCFRSRERITTIPTEVYDFIKQAKDILSTELIPHQEQEVEMTSEEIKHKNTNDFVTLSLKEYAKLSKEDKEKYRAKKAEAEKENVQ